jgi:hypothetical protein
MVQNIGNTSSAFPIFHLPFSIFHSVDSLHHRLDTYSAKPVESPPAIHQSSPTARLLPGSAQPPQKSPARAPSRHQKKAKQKRASRGRDALVRSFVGTVYLGTDFQDPASRDQCSEMERKSGKVRHTQQMAVARTGLESQVQRPRFIPTPPNLNKATPPLHRPGFRHERATLVER